MSTWPKKRSEFRSARDPVIVAAPAKKRFGVISFFGTALRKICTILGAILLFFLVLGMWSAAKTREKPVSLPNRMVLAMKMDKALPEKRGAQDYFSQFGLAETPVTATDVVDALDIASRDARVKGFVLTIRSGGYEIAQLQEIRNAVLKFRKSGKFAKIYSASYGEGGSGLGMYYLASAFDEIWMQPVGVVSIAGLSAQMPYFKTLLAEYGVKAQFFQRKEFKSAMENLTADEMSPASRQMMTELIRDLGTQVVSDVRASRPKVASSFGRLIDTGLFTDREALAAGLIDRLDYGDVLQSEILVKLDGDAESTRTVMTDIADYAASGPKIARSANGRIAVIYVQGMIIDSGGPPPYAFDDKSADATVLSRTIREAARNGNIDTIVLRLDSPGGSPSASETIRRAIVWAKTKKKKRIIVSMGSTAASGAYWISADADKIYADPATLTGSIGVVGGKFDLSGLFEKFDVKWDGVAFGQNAGMWTVSRGFNASEQERFEASLDNVYEHFIAIVAKGRNLPPQQVEQIAKGRVWTGRQALAVRLVDELGGLDKVLDDIALEKKLPSRHALMISELPKPENPLQALYDIVNKKSPFGAALPDSGMRQIEAFLPLLQNKPLVYAPLPVL